MSLGYGICRIPITTPNEQRELMLQSMLCSFFSLGCKLSILSSTHNVKEEEEEEEEENSGPHCEKKNFSRAGEHLIHHNHWYNSSLIIDHRSLIIIEEERRAKKKRERNHSSSMAKEFSKLCNEKPTNLRTLCSLTLEIMVN